MNAKMTAWNTALRGDDILTYMMQTTIAGKRNLNKLMKQMSSDGFQCVGEGYDPKKEKFIVLFSKPFESKNSWLEFAKASPFLIEEVNHKTGKVKVINGKRKRRKRTTGCNS